jgi:hypothetical protein
LIDGSDGFGWKAKGVQIFAQTGPEKIIRSGRRTSTQPIDPYAGES